MSISEKLTAIAENIEAEIADANEKTGESDYTLHDAVHTLIDGYGQGGGAYNIVSTDNGDGTQSLAITDAQGAPVILPRSITENGTYTAPEGVDGYNPVVVNTGGFAGSYKTNGILNINVSDNSLSGFGKANYITPNPQIDYTNPWEIKITFIADESAVGKGNSLCGTIGSNHKNVSMQILDEGRSIFWFGYSTNGSSWNYTVSIPFADIVIAAGKKYELISKWDGEKFYGKAKDVESGVEYTNSVNVSEPFFDNSSELSFGTNYPSAGGAFVAHGEICLNETYIKNNGVIVFGRI